MRQQPASTAKPSPGRRDAARAAQPDRRLNILLAAEKLFALRGYNAVSIRDIAAEAGVPLALVGYYYGAKHELYHAIFESWSGTVATRLAGLQAAVATPDLEQRLAQILEAFVGPVIALQQSPEGQHYAMMAARELAVPGAEAERAQREFFDPMAHAFIDALMACAPGTSRGQIAWCYQFMLGALLHFLADRRVERLSGGQNRAADPAAQGQLLAFLRTGFRGALATAPTKKATPRRPA